MKQKSFKNFLIQGLEVSGYTFTSEVIDNLCLYLELLSKWNKTHNLTAITNPKDMVILHILDSLSVLAYLEGKNILDVGSGAGLPGLVLAIVDSSRHFTLLDSANKKTTFLTHVVYKLGLNNVSIVCGRVEQYEGASTEKFDMILSRAFSSLQQMVECSKHLLNQSGVFLAMKGVYPIDEMAELASSILVEAVISCENPFIHAKRHLVKLRNAS